MISNKFLKKGFTLVELAIVMVIVAILIAAILKGREVLTNMKLNAMISDIKEFRTSYDQFKEKYNFAPGDYPLASNEWKNTYDGDGNGSIDFGTIEPTIAWNHLSNSGFLKHFYTAQGYGLLTPSDVGVVIPSAPFTGAAYSLFKYTLPDSNDNYGNVDSIVTGRITDYSNVNGAFLTPEQAYFIDSKLDDGNPAGGHLFSWVGGNGFDESSAACVLDADDGDYNNDTYNLSQVQAVCYIVYLLADPYIGK